MAGSDNRYGRNAELLAEREAILALPPDQQGPALIAMSQRRSGLPSIPGGFREPGPDSEGGAYTEGLPPATGLYADTTRGLPTQNLANSGKVGGVAEKRGEDASTTTAPLPNVLNGLSPGMQGILTQQRSLARELGEVAEGVEGVRQNQRQRLAEGERDASRAYAAEQRRLTQELERRVQPIPEFVPTRETARDIGSLASLLMVAGASLGGKGKQGALMAVQAMTGMMAGYRQGRQDLYQRERQNFETGLRQVQAQNTQLQEAFARSQRLAQTDLEAARQQFQVDAVALGADLPRLAGRQAGGQIELQIMQQNATLLGQIEQRRAAIEQAAAVRRETQQNELQREQRRQQAQIDAEGRRQQDQIADERRRNLQQAGIRAQYIIENQPEDRRARTVEVLSRAASGPQVAKSINDNYTIFESSEAAARLVAQYRDAVGPLGAALNAVRADPASSALRSITGWFTGQEGDNVRGEAAMNQAIDRAVETGQLSQDMAARAKILSKTLFSLALADAQATGRPTVFLERALNAFYSQSLRDTTLLEIIHGRAEEATRRLPDPSLRPNTLRNYNDDFSILSTMRDNRFDPNAFLERYPQVGSGGTAPRRPNLRDFGPGTTTTPSTGGWSIRPVTPEAR